MTSYSHANRPFKVATTLGADELLLLGFTGRESVSRPFSFQLELVSENLEIDPRVVLRNGAAIAITMPDGSERFVHGLVSRFTQLGTRKDVAFYGAEIVPWLWFLSLSHDCKVFQNKTVLEIVEEVFESQGYTAYEIACTRSYPRRDYCVQYRESHLDFVSRLMEEEGIFYFFRHNDREHVLVLADTNSAVEPCPGAPTARVTVQSGADEDTITRLVREDAVFVGKVTLGDFDPLQPALTLRSSISGDGHEEVYDYQPVIYTELDEGDRYARIRLESEEARQRVIRGEGTCRAFQAGFRVDVEGHDRSDMNVTCLLTEVRHSARSGGYGSSDETFEYANEFVAIPFDIPYRPPRATPKPSARGAQTATVVGKAGEEIWTDKHGRVKVQFHWDRQGKKDENSSCWVRVSTAWAGKSWGAIHLPRLGQEVLVDFIEGDLDRPLVVGSLYNAELIPPYPLPDEQTKSGIRSRSSKGGHLGAYNEILLEDKAGDELFGLRAMKDMVVAVGEGMTVVVGTDREEEIANDEKITIGGDRTKEVQGNETTRIHGAREEEVAGSEKQIIKGRREMEVKGEERLVVGGSRSTAVKQSDALDVGSNLDLSAKSNIAVKAGAKIVLQARAGIELKVGATSIKLTPAGIELKAPQIKLDGQAQVELKAPILMGQADAMLQLKGAIAQVNGDGMLTVRGGITMIN